MKKRVPFVPRPDNDLLKNVSFLVQGFVLSAACKVIYSHSAQMSNRFCLCVKNLNSTVKHRCMFNLYDTLCFGPKTQEIKTEECINLCAENICASLSWFNKLY